MKTYFLYVLKCADQSYYTGHTNELDKRVAEHKNGQGGIYTRERLPVELVYSEEFSSRSEAFRAEQKLKKWSRAKKEAVIYKGWTALKSWKQHKET